VIVTYRAIRKWCRKFGQHCANQLGRRRPQPGDTWHLDEVLLTIRGERQYLWRVVDQDGHVLDILVQRRRDKGAERRELLPGVEHRQHQYLNNRAKNSHQPICQWERRMQGVKSPGQAQRFLAAHGRITSHFRPRRYLFSAREYRHEMLQKFQTWREITGIAMAAFGHNPPVSCPRLRRSRM
jgi:putative transposase